MKDEIDTILRYLDHNDDEINDLKESILMLDISKSTELESSINFLQHLIAQVSIVSHDYIGYYYMFLGCIYYEKGEYRNSLLSLKRANPELWETQIHKSLIHWLIGLSYMQINEYIQAQSELKSAIDRLETIPRTNSDRAQTELKSIIHRRIYEILIIISKTSAHFI